MMMKIVRWTSLVTVCDDEVCSKREKFRIVNREVKDKTSVKRCFQSADLSVTRKAKVLKDFSFPWFDMKLLWVSKLETFLFLNVKIYHFFFGCRAQISCLTNRQRPSLVPNVLKFTSSYLNLDNLSLIGYSLPWILATTHSSSLKAKQWSESNMKHIFGKIF